MNENNFISTTKKEEENVKRFLFTRLQLYGLFYAFDCFYT